MRDVRTGPETGDGRQGAEPRDRVQRTGDKEQRHKTGWETNYKDVREGTKEFKQGQEKGTEEWVAGGREE
jgi:hypothetical protein